VYVEVASKAPRIGDGQSYEGSAELALAASFIDREIALARSDPNSSLGARGVDSSADLFPARRTQRACAAVSKESRVTA
jgi:hypothetical protein